MSLMRMTRVAFTPKGWLLKAQLSNGAVVYGKNQPGFGGRGVYVHRDLIEPEFLHLEKFLGDGGVFLDVGANTGIYTLKAAKHYAQRGTVVAVEPFPDVLATLYHSVRANGFANVRIRNFCASHETGETSFWMNFGKPNSFSLVKMDTNASRLSVLAVSLDDLVRWERLDRVDYVKIDAEGAERDILAGAAEVIAAHRPIIQVEVALKETPVSLAEYSSFRAPNSPNKLCIPNEHACIDVPRRLGWQVVA
jgi:FkbM family methyltransferase